MDVARLFKALANEERLRIAALVAERPRSHTEILGAVGVAPAAMARHVKVLRSAGLIASASERGRTVYRFSRRPLLDALRAIDDRPGPPALPDDLDAHGREVLGNFLVDGKLKAIPVQQKKRDAVLRFLAGRFEPGRTYREKEVNAVLAAYHDDYATLRRALVDAHLLARERGVYWRVEPAAPPMRDGAVGL